MYIGNKAIATRDDYDDDDDDDDGNGNGIGDADTYTIPCTISFFRFLEEEKKTTHQQRIECVYFMR